MTVEMCISVNSNDAPSVNIWNHTSFIIIGKFQANNLSFFNLFVSNKAQDTILSFILKTIRSEKLLALVIIVLILQRQNSDPI